MAVVDAADDDATIQSEAVFARGTSKALTLQNNSTPPPPRIPRRSLHSALTSKTYNKV